MGSTTPPGSGHTRDEFLKKSALLTTGVAVSGLVAACGSSSSSSSPSTSHTTSAAANGPKRGGVLTLGLSDTESSEKLDPTTCAVGSQFTLAGLVYNTLASVNYLDWSVSPELAESWDFNKDFTKWQLKLRKGVNWHNGKPFTSDDVVWSLRRILDPKVGSTVISRAQISMTPHGITANGPSEVILKLTRPDSLIPFYLSRPAVSIVPAGVTPRTVATSIGTGPFKLVSWQPATSWKVVRNDDYWETGLPYLDSVEEVINTDSAARVAGVTTGQFQLAEEIDYATAKSLAHNSAVQILPFVKAINRLIVMDRSKPPFSDQRVATAFRLAMNRQEAVNAVYAGYAVPTSDIPLPPNDPYYPPGLGVRPYDPEQAKSLLKQAGYPNGLKVQMFTSTVVSGMVDLAVTYAQTAAPAGISVNVSQWPPATYWDQVWLTKPFYTTYWETAFPPDDLWYIYGPHGPFNEAHLQIPQFINDFDKILSTGDKPEQIRICQQGLALAATAWAHIIPANVTSPWLASTKLHGVVGDPPNFRIRLTRAYLD
jgi:peptide/nickel transport system substrate-binding protein